MPRLAFALLLLALTGSLASRSRADSSAHGLPYFVPDAHGVQYDEHIPTPADFFGFPIGEYHLTHHELLAYYQALAAAAPERITLQEIGQTHGRRSQVLLTISSAANQARIDAIRDANVANALGRSAAPEDAPVVVWLGYSIHGDEPSGANAAPLVAYHLVAGRGPEIDRLLAQAVILIDPFLNPDGLDRFAAWSNDHRGRVPNADPADREHNEAWPGSRGNYYWFDLNRDWLPAVHPVSRAHLATFHRWRPALLCDFHEMGPDETYFFQPGVPEMTNALIPAADRELTRRLAEFHARALDRLGALYFSGEYFDDFYVGKGSTYPDLNGSIGLLFEQASARGHSQIGANGRLTLRAAVRNQVATSLSSLRGAVELRRDLLNYQHESTGEALRQAAKAEIKAYVFAAPGDPVRLDRFCQLLRWHEIEFRPLTQELTVRNKSFAPGQSVVVAARQPAYRLLTSMFELRTDFPRHAFYDTSAWNVAEAYGLVWQALDVEVPEVALGPANLAPSAAAAVDPGTGGAAFAFAWSHYYAPRALWRLLAAHVRVRVALRPFTATTSAGEATLPAGSIVVPRGSRAAGGADLEQLAARIAEEDSVPVRRILSSLTPEGPDLGSGRMRPLSLPVAALLVGEGVNAARAGEVWHLFDRELGLPLTLIDREHLTASNLRRFTALIVVDGRFQPGEDLRHWVEAGGTLIVSGEAIRSLIEAKWTEADLRRVDYPAGRMAFAEAREEAASRSTAGAIVRALVDRTHPIAFGLPRDEIALFRDGNVFLAPGRNPFSSPLIYADPPLVSGYMNGPNQRALAGSAAIQVHTMREGRVILMPDPPAYRGYWHDPARLLINAVFFGPLMRVDTERIED